QFNGSRVEVDPVDIVESNIRLGLLQFLLEDSWVDSLSEFVLFPTQVLGGKLIDSLEGERAGSQGRLADSEIEDVIGPHVLGKQFGQCLGDGEAREHLGSVIG